MKKSQDKGVQQFLDELKKFDTEKYKIVTDARNIVFKEYPKVNERIIYGGIMFTLDEDVGGLFVSTHHVSFEFSKGYTFRDPKTLLEGTGKYRRHLKLKTPEEVKTKDVSSFVKQFE